MSQLSELVEFDRYRFARDEFGGLSEFRSSLSGERIFLVVDCENYRLARLHVLEGARSGNDGEAAKWFRKEMEAVRRLHHPQLNPVLSFGEDDTELFYTEAVVDGEPLGDYLRRNGPLPVPHAIRLTLELIEILTFDRALPRTVENFSLHGLFLKPDLDDGASLIFSDYSGWNQDCLLSESRLVERIMRLLVSLLAGEFVEPGAPALDFADAPEPLRNLIEIAARGDYDPRLERIASFRQAMQRIQNAPSETASPLSPPKRQFHEWLEDEESPLQIGPDFRRLSQAELNGSAGSPELSYAIDAKPERAIGPRKVRFQLFPGESTVPTLSWLEQHRAALRKSGRGFPNQLRVTTTLSRGKCLLIGEEKIEGLSFRRIVEKAGPLALPHLLSLAGKLSAALDSIEKSAGASPVWWLPPENLFVVTGRSDLASLHDALDRFGTETWQRLPVRLRLHQTAESLVNGVDLPRPLLDRMRSGARNGDAARRLAVMLPFLWYGLTGRKLRWHEPLIQPKDREDLPPEATVILERFRKQVLADPSSIHANVIDLLAGGNDPDLSAGIGKTSRVPTPEAVSIQNLAPVARTGLSAPAPFLESLEPTPLQSADSKIEPDVLPDAKPEIEPTEIESLGMIDDTSDGRVSAPLSEPGSNKQRETDAEGEAPIAAEPDVDPVVESISQENSSDTDSSEKSESLGLIEDDFFSAISETETPKMKTAPDRDEKVATDSRSDLAGLSASEGEETSDIDLLDGVGAFLESTRKASGSSLDSDTDTDSANRDEDPVISEVQPAFFPVPKAGRPGFGERLLEDCARSSANAPAGAVSAGTSSPRTWIRLTCLSLVVIGLTWGVARAIGEVSSWASRQALAEETFLLAHYPEMKTTRPDSPVSESAAPITKDGNQAIGQLPVTGTVESVAEAIQLGDNNRETGQFFAAVSYYLRAVELESSSASTEARTGLRECLQAWSESDDPPSLSGEPISLLEKAADFAPLAAASLLAHHFENRDSQLYRHWLTRSADAGHTGDQRELGLLLARIPGEMVAAAEWLRQAADRGDNSAQFHFGECLVFGRGVARNVHLAVNDYLAKAVEGGDGRAMELLGVCYAEGRNVTADPDRARDLFEKAIAAGNFDAYYNLAVRYAKGHGAAKNEKEAARLFREGAGKGDAACMYAYGRCLETGFGVSSDFEDARDWLRKAAELGFDDARAWCGLNDVVLADNGAK